MPWYSDESYIRSLCGGRLTLESGVPVSSSDQSAKSTLYLTPFNGNVVGLYNGSKWIARQFSETSLALSGLTSGKNYDVFEYDNSGTLALELTAWTNDTTRATALTLQDGVYVKSGATTRRYRGTLRTTGTTTTEDSQTKRFVWNFYNRRTRGLYRFDNTSHAYDSTTIRQWNNDTANQIEWVLGETQTLLIIAGGSLTTASSGSLGAMLGVGENTVAGNGVLEPPFATTFGIPFGYKMDARVGYNRATLVERGTGTATTSFWYGFVGSGVAC